MENEKYEKKLFEACKCGHLETFKKLYPKFSIAQYTKDEASNGREIDYRNLDERYYYRHDCITKCLKYACEGRHHEIFDIIYKDDIENLDHDTLVILMADECERGDGYIVDLLLEHLSEIETSALRINLCLTKACLGNNAHIFDIFMSSGYVFGYVLLPHYYRSLDNISNIVAHLLKKATYDISMWNLVQRIIDILIKEKVEPGAPTFLKDPRSKDYIKRLDKITIKHKDISEIIMSNKKNINIDLCRLICKFL